ncbi:hypothetical protein KILIM_021_00370 [Kineosphaera limosa NBRC 100340]|uniref:Uncharacterized protein n=1 Tax=Kineosphaera limosa NBRC 100340 TaxID=1184609 RepID=K6WTR0_9MICO|nr:hypothetical protein KILIM_021_00370 [Kineosphaera limosa NBRC 100340]
MTLGTSFSPEPAGGVLVAGASGLEAEESGAWPQAAIRDREASEIAGSRSGDRRREVFMAVI